MYLITYNCIYDYAHTIRIYIYIDVYIYRCICICICICISIYMHTYRIIFFIWLLDGFSPSHLVSQWNLLRCCFGCFHYWRHNLGHRQQELTYHSTGLTLDSRHSLWPHTVDVFFFQKFHEQAPRSPEEKSCCHPWNSGSSLPFPVFFRGRSMKKLRWEDFHSPFFLGFFGSKTT